MSRCQDPQSLDSLKYCYTFNAPKEEERKYEINVYRHTTRKGYDLESVGVFAVDT